MLWVGPAASVCLASHVFDSAPHSTAARARCFALAPYSPLHRRNRRASSAVGPDLQAGAAVMEEREVIVSPFFEAANRFSVSLSFFSNKLARLHFYTYTL